MAVHLYGLDPLTATPMQCGNGAHISYPVRWGRALPNRKKMGDHKLSHLRTVTDGGWAVNDGGSRVTVGGNRRWLLLRRSRLNKNMPLTVS